MKDITTKELIDSYKTIIAYLEYLNNLKKSVDKSDKNV